MLKNTSIGGVAKRYDNLSGALSRDIALEQQWPGSDSRDYRALNMHNFLDTCLNDASEISIGIYVKRI
jgi:hypothetical protein